MSIGALNACRCLKKIQNIQVYSVAFTHMNIVGLFVIWSRCALPSSDSDFWAFVRTFSHNIHQTHRDRVQSHENQYTCMCDWWRVVSLHLASKLGKYVGVQQRGIFVMSVSWELTCIVLCLRTRKDTDHSYRRAWMVNMIQGLLLCCFRIGARKGWRVHQHTSLRCFLKKNWCAWFCEEYGMYLSHA